MADQDLDELIKLIVGDEDGSPFVSVKDDVVKIDGRLTKGQIRALADLLQPVVIPMEMVREALAHLPFDVANQPTAIPKWEWLANRLTEALAEPHRPCECCGVTLSGEILWTPTHEVWQVPTEKGRSMFPEKMLGNFSSKDEADEAAYLWDADEPAPDKHEYRRIEVRPAKPPEERPHGR